MAALNSTADINAYVNYFSTYGAGMMNPGTFYSKQLLDTIRLDANMYSYYRYADEQPIQDKSDSLSIRRWSPLQAHTVPLVEGTPPVTDKGSVEKYTLTADQYGRYMEFTDKVDFKIVDPIIAHYTKEYAIVAIETLDLLAQKALLAVAQKFYAGIVATPDLLRPWSKPSIADLRLIGLSLKRQLVKPRSNGRYHVLVSPEFSYDMLDDTYVKSYMTINQSTKSMYENGTLVPLFGFEFYEVMNCPTKYTFPQVVASVLKYFYIEYAVVASNYGLSAQDITDGFALQNNGTMYIKWRKVEVTAANAAIAAGYTTDSRTGQAASYIPARTDYDLGALAILKSGCAAMKMQHTLILGKDALVRTGIANEGNAKVYVKEKGSAGVLDPIDQRQSIGFKINSVGFGSCRTEAVVDYINVPSQLN